MISILTRLKIADNCGVRLVQCIKMLIGFYARKTKPGRPLVIVVKRTIIRRGKRLIDGAVSRGLIVRASFAFFRNFGVWISFNQNAVILINKRIAPIGKRLRGPFIKEICIKYNFLGTVTRFVI